jgi:small subunit ribosomal protein S17e
MPFELNGGVMLGRIRPSFIKRISRQLVEKHRGELTKDFKENKLIIKDLIDVPTHKLLNRIAGYTTRLMTHKEIM